MADMLTENLRKLKFQGVKGWIEFTEASQAVESDGLIYQQKGKLDN